MNWVQLIQLFGIMAGALIFGLLALVVGLDFYTKFAARGKVIAFFMDQRSFYGMMLKVKDNKISIGTGENKEEYLLIQQKQFWALWPSALPRILQTVVRAHLYVKGNPDPVDPGNIETTITSKMIRIMTDEAMLKQTWKDLRDTVTGAAGGSRSLAIIILFACIGSIGMGVINIIVTLGIKKTLGG